MRVPFSQLRFPTVARPRLGRERAPRRPPQERELVARPRAEERERPRLAHGGASRASTGSSPGGTSSSCPTCRAGPSTSSPPTAGDPWNDGSRLFGGRRARLQVRARQRHGARGRREPRLRPGRGGPRRRQPHRLRDLLRGEAAVLHRGQPGLPALRPQRGERLHDLLLPGAAAVLLAAHRARAAGRRPRASSWTRPASTTILGAAKLVGRTTSGWNVGRPGGGDRARVRARRRRAPSATSVEVEPLTNYFVGRAQHELGLARRRSASWAPPSIRDLRHAGPRRRCSSDRAFVGGVDGHVFLDGKRDWVVSGGLSGSTRLGQPGVACCALQRAAQRYYQRPDAPHVSVDPHGDVALGLERAASASTRTAATSPSTPASGASAPASSRTTSASRPRRDRGGAHGQVLFRKLTPDALDAQPAARGREVVDLQLRRASRQGDGVAGGARRAQLRNYWQLDLDARQVLEHLGRQADARRADHDPARHREPGRRAPRATPAGRFWVDATAAALEPRVRQPQPPVLGDPQPPAVRRRSPCRRRPTCLRAHTVAQYLATVPDATATRPTAAATSSAASSRPSGRSRCA